MSCYLYQRPDSPNWFIGDYDERSGETKRFSARTRDKQLAEKKLAAHVLGRDEAKLKSNISLAYLITRYWTLEGQFLASKDTVKAVMGLVVEHEPERMLFDWSRADQEKFIGKFTNKDGEPLSDGTKRRYFGVLKTAAKFLKGREEIPSVPDMVNMEVEDGKGAPVMPVEIAKTLFEHAVHPHQQLYLLLELTTVPRPKYLTEVTWDRISWEDSVIDYRKPGPARALKKRDKLKRRAVAALCPAALAFLKANRSVGHILKWNGKRLKTFKMTYQHVASNAGVVGYSSYSLRKLGATFMRRNRVSELDIKTMLAHKITGETGRYAHEEPEYLVDVRATMQRLLEALDPPWLRPFFPRQAVPNDGLLHSYFTAAVGSTEQVIDFVGARDRDRTCDPYHVKKELSQVIQRLKVANDD